MDSPLHCSWASLVAQTVENPPATRETWVPALGWEDSLEEGMATRSCILAWRIPWTEELRMIISKSFHVAANGIVSFFLRAE